MKQRSATVFRTGGTSQSTQLSEKRDLPQSGWRLSIFSKNFNSKSLRSDSYKWTEEQGLPPSEPETTHHQEQLVEIVETQRAKTQIFEPLPPIKVCVKKVTRSRSLLFYSHMQNKKEEIRKQEEPVSPVEEWNHFHEKQGLYKSFYSTNHILVVNSKPFESPPLIVPRKITEKTLQ